MTAEPAGDLAPEEPHVPHRADLADPGQRLLARIVDTLIVGLPVVAVLLQTVPRSRLDVLAPPLVALLLLAYEAPQIALWGRTPGKRVAGIEVVPADGAERLGAGRALLRAATYNLPIAVRPVPVLGLLAGFFWVVNGAFIYEGARREVPDGARRALHDRFAGTDVVRARPEAPGSPE
ncbi:RDD family protein [Actinomadura rubteroloni]|uniref:RDD family protein n=1 Tax=Actinomadura rubteroloni TaxID=1926885 RepID=A0A2P4UP84_9ACTN|nr:RDD family protein [Actinomadura rubteroloni]POM26861.1 RDD family protein [Actinomadura rubteroloni]